MTSEAVGTPDLKSLRLLSDSGRTAQVYLWDDHTVLKLARDARLAASFERESLALQAAGATPGLAPGFRGAVTIDGRPGLLMERLDGIDLLKELEKKPWRTWRVGRELAEVHARLHETPAAPGMDGAKDRIRHQLASELVPDDIRPEALALLEQAPDGDRLCHVDFHPGNLMRLRDGSLRVVDFGPACSGDPVWDHAATVALLQIAAPPPGASAWMRGLVRLLRGVLLRAYRRRYEQLRAVEKANLERWIRIYLAQRLADDIPEERARILKELGASPSARVSKRAM
jgi:aminoglycoside phosphotransferase (APT) family kinase protein